MRRHGSSSLVILFASVLSLSSLRDGRWTIGVAAIGNRDRGDRFGKIGAKGKKGGGAAVAAVATHDDHEWPECSLPWDPYHPQTKCVPQAIYTCPPGQILSGDRCLRTLFAPQTIKCPAFSELVGKECKTRVTTEPMPECPPGFYQEVNGKVGKGKGGYHCAKMEVINAAVSCDDGYHLSKGMCVKKHSWKPKWSCPGGLKETKSGCVKEVVTRSRETCPDGYHFQRAKGNKESCVKVITVPAGVGCSKDYEMIDGSCIKEKRVSVASACPKGSKLDGKYCVSQSLVKAEWACPEGYLFNVGFCTAVQSAQPFPVCPRHFDMIDGHCVKESKFGPNHVCPKGAQLRDGMCLTREIVPYDSACPAGSFLKGSAFSQYCVSQESIPAEQKCPNKWTEVGGSCVKTMKNPERLVCDNGYSLDKNDMCARMLTYKAEMVCRNEAGTHLKGSRCESEVRVEPTMTCRRGELTASNECHIEHVIEPEGYCTKGFQVNPEHRELCSRKISAPLDIVCPPGSDFKLGKCAVCTTHPPVITCPKHFFISPSGGCQASHTKAPTYGCPAGYVIEKGMCYPSAGEGGLLKGLKKDKK